MHGLVFAAPVSPYGDMARGPVWGFLWVLWILPAILCERALAGFGDPAAFTYGSISLSGAYR